jgi:DNA-binding PadR family transcriptional regulator
MNLCNTTRFVWAASYGQIYPELARLEPQAVLVNGWPPNTVVATRFVVQATTRDGKPYGNEGMQFLRLRWGRVVEDYIYEDTQKLVGELERLGRHGPGEAVAAAA